MINEKDAVEIIIWAEKNGIKIYLDGGWGVDALLGVQTREHNDLDVFIEKKNGVKFIALMKQKGFSEIPKIFTTAFHTVWADTKDRIVDLHLFEWNAQGGLVFEGETYPARVFSGTGKIGGIPVNCIPAEEQVLFHLGYEYDANDAHDVKLLCERFHLPIPDAYK